MSIHSYVFLLAFLPLVWLGYFGLNKCKFYSAAQWFLTAASFGFYGWQDSVLCLLLAANIGFNYLIHMLLTNKSLKEQVRKPILIGALLGNIGLLFYFKYLDFAIVNINALTGSALSLKNIILPLGISFYTFRQISFVTDSYKKVMGRYRLTEYALYVSFFPLLAAGPIVHHSQLMPQLAYRERKKINYGYLVSGLEYLVWGLAKKVLLADTFARIYESGSVSVRNLNSLSAAAVILAYTFQIYFDFSGYCDMVTGIGKLFGLDIPMNFNAPYKARSISEFWKKWHMTLTGFLTSYIYIPLGGNRKGLFRTCVNILIVFGVSGLWHGADWNFIVWGLLHGSMMVLHRLLKKQADRLPGWLGFLLTFGFVNVAWLFFASSDLLSPLKLVYMTVFGGWGGFTETVVSAACEGSLLYGLAGYFVKDTVLPLLGQLLTGGWIIAAFLICTLCPSVHEIVSAKCRKRLYFLWLALLLVWSLGRLSSVASFIYFQF